MRDGDPTPARHIKRTTRAQGVPGKLALQIGGRDRPIRGKTIEDEILEHEWHPARKERGLYWRGTQLLFLFCASGDAHDGAMDRHAAVRNPLIPAKAP